MSIFNNITTMMVGCFELGDPAIPRVSNLEPLNRAKSLGAMLIQSNMVINLRRCKFGKQFKLQILCLYTHPFEIFKNINNLIP